jgi:hypothetical protein
VQIYLDEPSDVEFLKKANDVKLPQICNLRIGGLHYMASPTNQTAVNDFFEYSISKPVNHLYLGSGGETNIECFKQGLESILPLVAKEVYIWEFIIDIRMLKVNDSSMWLIKIDDNREMP